jgi:hypothetical protein
VPGRKSPVLREGEDEKRRTGRHKLGEEMSRERRGEERGSEQRR